MSKIFTLFLLFFFLVISMPVQADSPQIPNKLIDTAGFMRDVKQAQFLRLNNRVSEKDFIKMMKEPNTIVLDARSRERFDQMHIAGAKHLNFADFTVETLKALIPNDKTRVLIYCNNNIEGEPIAFASKIATSALNLSTYTSLYSYGYRNIVELGPVINPAQSALRFEGSLVKDGN